MVEQVEIACYEHRYVEGLRFERQAWRVSRSESKRGFPVGREHGPRHDRDVWILWNSMSIDAR